MIDFEGITDGGRKRTLGDYSGLKLDSTGKAGNRMRGNNARDLKLKVDCVANVSNRGCCKNVIDDDE
jgi:hypothetical protein